LVLKATQILVKLSKNIMAFLHPNLEKIHLKNLARFPKMLARLDKKKWFLSNIFTTSI